MAVGVRSVNCRLIIYTCKGQKGKPEREKKKKNKKVISFTMEFKAAGSKQSKFAIFNEKCKKVFPLSAT